MKRASVLSVLALVGCASSNPAPPGSSDDGMITLTMSPFVVPAGGEVYKCQNFANPFGGADTEVTAFESHMTKGSHHLLLFYKPGATEEDYQAWAWPIVEQLAR